jgi:hypothetical protein
MVCKSIFFLNSITQKKMVELHYYMKVCIEISHNIGNFSIFFKFSLKYFNQQKTNVALF